MVTLECEEASFEAAGTMKKGKTKEFQFLSSLEGPDTYVFGQETPKSLQLHFAFPARKQMYPCHVEDMTCRPGVKHPSVPARLCTNRW